MWIRIRNTALNAVFWIRIRIVFYVDPDTDADPAFYLNVDPDTDPGSQTYADPDPDPS
jgi:hypothetical protein